MGPTDGELVRRTVAGEVSAFEALLDRYYADCLRHAYHMLGDRADAEEVVQDTFLRAYHALDRYQDQQRFRAWLFAILTNRCRSRGAKTRRRQSFLSHYRDAAPPVEHAPELDGGELYDRIRAALRELPPDHREAFLLHYVEGAPYTEISAMTGAGVSALKMRVKRARERLAQLLSDLDE